MIKYYSCTNDDIATAYPDNPNVSHNSIAGMTSCDGRHLIIMPHPERSFMDRQVPYKDVDYKKFVEKIKFYIHLGILCLIICMTIVLIIFN